MQDNTEKVKEEKAAEKKIAEREWGKERDGGGGHLDRVSACTER